MFEKPKNQIGQEVYGSPAQIWTELDVLASEFFGSSKSAIEWAERFESLNITAVSSGCTCYHNRELEGFKDPAAECVTYSIQHTTHNTTHNAMMQ